MNRPFYAFGSLLAALALAVLAVSSTSRSTSVSAPATPETTRVANRAAAAARNRPGFCGILCVLPADDVMAADMELAAADCLATGADLPVGRTWSDWECPCDWAQSVRESKPVMETRITLATHDPAQLSGNASPDCRSYYDPAYDAAVYGITLGSSKLNWDEYSVLLDEALAVRPSQAAGAEFTNPVRSSRWLVDFAASSLDRAGLLLQSAAEELRQAAGDDNRGQIASQSQPDQR